jgi:hypothetical protein
MRPPAVHPFRRALRCGVATVVLGLAAGCGGSGATGSAAPAPPAATHAGTVVTTASLKPGQAVPAPAEKAVLTVTGKITAANQKGKLALDRRTIERLGVSQVRLYEPWNKENMDFRGVWLQDLLAVAGAKPDATKVHIVALDDYAVDVTLADIRAGGIMLATRAGDGSDIGVDKGGPTRIVYLDGVKAGANADQWIWSLKSIDVR